MDTPAARESVCRQKGVTMSYARNTIEYQAPAAYFACFSRNATTYAMWAFFIF